jgi:uncharacterized membrane protein HdeD (DUF308 family)
MTTTSDINTTGASVADLLARNWWLLALRGLVAVIFGVLAFVWPEVTILTLVYLFGAYAMANGILAFVVAYKAPKGYSRLGSLIVGGVISIAAGIIAFLLPEITALGLVILIAAWAIVTGVLEIVAAMRLRKVITNEWLLVLAGIASIAFGVVAFFMPSASALALMWWIGAYTLAFGVLLLVLAFRMRHWKGFSPTAPRMA